MAFREVDDKLWVKIESFLLPGTPKTGRPRTDERRAFNSILYVLTTGCAWSDTPKIYGTKSTIHRLHLELCRNGAYEQIFQMLLLERDELKKLKLSICSIDTDSIPAKKGEHWLYEYKKVKGSKISMLVNKDGLPLSVSLFPANIPTQRLTSQ